MAVTQWLAWPFRFIFALGLESSAHRLMESHEWREAVEVYRRLLRWSPEQAAFHTDAGLAHLMLNEFEPAEDRFREAIRLKPESLRTYDFLGMLLANQGRIDEARDVWERLILVSRALAERHPFFYERFARDRIEEAQKRLAVLETPDFAGFTVDPGFSEYPGSAPGSVDG